MANWFRAFEIAVLVIGLGFAGIQIFIGLEDSRSSRSTDFVKSYYSKETGFYDSQRELDQWVYDALQKARTDGGFQGIDFIKDRAKYFEKRNEIIGKEYLDSNSPIVTSEKFEKLKKIEGVTFRVGYFFDSVSYCILQRACDGNIISYVMRNDIKGFFEAVCPFHVHITTNYGNKGFLSNSARFLVDTSEANEKFLCEQKLLHLASKVEVEGTFSKWFSDFFSPKRL